MPCHLVWEPQRLAATKPTTCDELALGTPARSANRSGRRCGCGPRIVNRPNPNNPTGLHPRGGRPLRREYATRHFQALAEEAGLPAIRLHDLRHTSASLALAAGVEMKAVSDRLGHSQISTTADLYTHVSRGLGRAAAEQIAGALKASSQTVPAASLQQSPENSPQKEDDADAHP